MSILVDENTRLLVQGITGKEGSFHAMRCMEYGTNLVAGVTPGRGGMTLGMQAWRLRVQTLDGHAITLKQSLIRCATAWLSLAAFGIGYWWVLIDGQRRSWPDIASKTETVVLPKK